MPRILLTQPYKGKATGDFIEATDAQWAALPADVAIDVDTGRASGSGGQAPTVDAQGRVQATPGPPMPTVRGALGETARQIGGATADQARALTDVVGVTNPGAQSFFRDEGKPGLINSTGLGMMLLPWTRLLKAGAAVGAPIGKALAQLPFLPGGVRTVLRAAPEVLGSMGAGTLAGAGVESVVAPLEGRPTEVGGPMRAGATAGLLGRLLNMGRPTVGPNVGAVNAEVDARAASPEPLSSAEQFAPVGPMPASAGRLLGGRPTMSPMPVPEPLPVTPLGAQQAAQGTRQTLRDTMTNLVEATFNEPGLTTMEPRMAEARMHDLLGGTPGLARLSEEYLARMKTVVATAGRTASVQYPGATQPVPLLRAMSDMIEQSRLAFEGRTGPPGSPADEAQQAAKAAYTMIRDTIRTSLAPEALTDFDHGQGFYKVGLGMRDLAKRTAGEVLDIPTMQRMLRDPKTRMPIERRLGEDTYQALLKGAGLPTAGEASTAMAPMAPNAFDALNNPLQDAARRLGLGPQGP
jgi:hypothetical protein